MFLKSFVPAHQQGHGHTDPLSIWSLCPPCGGWQLRVPWMTPINSWMESQVVRASQYLGGTTNKKDRAWLFSAVPGDRPTGNGHKLKHNKLQLNLSGERGSFTAGVMEHCYRLQNYQHPWRYSEPEQTQPQATCPAWPCSTPSTTLSLLLILFMFYCD